MPRKSPTDIATDPIHIAIMDNARKYAGFSDEQLLRCVEGNAPKQRNRLSTEARISWALIYAIRIRLGELE